MAWNNTKPRPQRRPKTGITPDSTAGRILQALRAGRMTSGELSERFSGYSSVTASLLKEGLVTRPLGDDGCWTITEAGLAACPLRNPLAAKVAAAPRAALSSRPALIAPPRQPAAAPIRATTHQEAQPIQPAAVPASTPSTGDSAMSKNGIDIAVKSPINKMRDAITAAIAGIAKTSAITRDELIARTKSDIPRATLVDAIKKMGRESTVLGAYGATAGRRYFDIRTLSASAEASPPQTKTAPNVKPAPIPAPVSVLPPVDTPPAAGAEAKPVEFAIYNDGRLAIVDNDEIFVMQREDVARLARFLGCFDQSVTQLAA